MNRLALLILVLVIGAAGLAVRAVRLGDRPMHTDESNHTEKFRLLWEKSHYRYDPFEFHGPVLNYSTLPSMWLSGTRLYAESTEANYRIVPAVFGAGLILLLLLLAPWLGWRATIIAGILTAISPAMVFYSRYYIQEMILVFFTFAAIIAGWRYSRSAGIGWALMAGAAFGLMHATKETWVLSAGAMGGAVVLSSLWTRMVNGHFHTVIPLLRRRPLIAATLIGVCLSALLFSSFLTYRRGPIDSIATYLTYFHRAGGQGAAATHDHPWHYYLQLLAWTHVKRGPIFTEGLLLLLAGFGFVASLLPRLLPEKQRHLARFLAFYTLLLTAGYAAIPYKTPWCLLSFFHGMILLAGIGAAALLRLAPMLVKPLVGLVLLAGATHLGYQSYLANFKLYADQSNPYVYAHTHRDVFNLVARVEKLAALDPAGRNMLIAVLAPPEDQWPLPWYFRKYGRAGYASRSEDVSRMLALRPPVVIVAEGMGEPPADEYSLPSTNSLRPQVLLMTYVRNDLWDKYMAQRSAEVARRRRTP